MYIYGKQANDRRNMKENKTNDYFQAGARIVRVLIPLDCIRCYSPGFDDKSAGKESWNRVKLSNLMRVIDLNLS